MRVHSIQVSPARQIDAAIAPAPDGGGWTTGFFKQPVSGPVWLGATNVAGDGQADRKHHGGPDKAVLAYSAAHYPAWRDQLAMPDLPFGAFAENFTIEGWDEESACIGDVVALGPALLQVTQPRQPCWKIAARWQRTNLTALVERSGRTGWYLRVLQEGLIEPGMELCLIERSHPEWSVSAATRVMRRRNNHRGAAALLACPALSAAWRETLTERLQKRSA